VSEDRLNMTGLWEGAYAYPAYKGPTTPFAAHIADVDGALSGTIIEPNMIGFTSDELEAILVGNRTGRSVDFTKTYDGSSDAAHDVDYVGQLSDDGDSVTGVWSLGELDGTFEMRRERSWEELAVTEAAEELPAAASVPTELPPP
jgi:hypothetical protein